MNKNDADVLFLLKYLDKCIKQYLDDKLKQYDLTSTQGRAVFYISYMEENNNYATPNDLINRFSLSKSTISELIDRLAAKNLVQKKIEKNRVYLLTTDCSKEFVNHFDVARKKLKEQATGNFSKEDEEKLKEYILKMIKNIKGDDAICGSK